MQEFVFTFLNIVKTPYAAELTAAGSPAIAERVLQWDKPLWEMSRYS